MPHALCWGEGGKTTRRQGHWGRTYGPGLAGQMSSGKKQETCGTIERCFFLSASLAFGMAGWEGAMKMCSWPCPGAPGAAVSWPSEQDIDGWVWHLMGGITSGCLPKSFHKALRSPVDGPPEASRQMQETSRPVSLSVSLCPGPTTCPPLWIPSLPSLVHSHQSCFATLMSVLKAVGGPMLSCQPVAPKPLPYSDLILTFQFIASPRPKVWSSLPLLWLSLCFPFGPHSLSGALHSSQSPTCVFRRSSS